VSRFTVYITPGAFEEDRNLPGHIKQRIKCEINQRREFGECGRGYTYLQLQRVGFEKEVFCRKRALPGTYFDIPDSDLGGPVLPVNGWSQPHGKRQHPSSLYSV